MEKIDSEESKQIQAISLLETIDQEFADDISFFRSNTFIVNENDNEKDEKILREMGYKVKYCSGEFDDFGNYYSGYFSINWRKRKRFIIF